jgi:hypothetical protein
VRLGASIDRLFRVTAVRSRLPAWKHETGIPLLLATAALAVEHTRGIQDEHLLRSNVDERQKTSR